MNRFQKMEVICLIMLSAVLATPLPAFAVPDQEAATSANATGGSADVVALDAAVATSEPFDPNIPKSASDALDKGKEALSLAKEKQWFAFSAGVIWLLMSLFKIARKNVWFMKEIPKRVLWIILPLLSISAMLLAKFQGDLSWGAAVGVMTSGPAVAFLNDFVKRGLLNKEPSSMKNDLFQLKR